MFETWQIIAIVVFAGILIGYFVWKKKQGSE
jgi:uncharacterized membrane-anchored protein YhcB (DUF1043 family)